MYNLKPIIAKNISRLRIKSGMTQSELAARLNYSDKAVSKWERAESIPDVCVLTEIADLFGVPLDSLVREHSVSVNEKPTKVAVNKAMSLGASYYLAKPFKSEILPAVISFSKMANIHCSFRDEKAYNVPF